MWKHQINYQVDTINWIPYTHPKFGFQIHRRERFKRVESDSFEIRSLVDPDNEAKNILDVSLCDRRIWSSKFNSVYW